MGLSRRHFLTLGAATVGSVALGRYFWPTSQAIEPIAPRIARDGFLDVTFTAERSRLWFGRQSISGLTYNGLAPGEVLELKAGDTLRLTLNNQLDEPTNLHYHGLHIPPTGTADDVFRHVLPGESYTYEFQLLPNHPATLAYYHPHVHGLVAKQVFGGLGGAIVVRGAIDEIPEIQAAREEIVVLKDFGDRFGRSLRGREHLGGRHGPILTANGRLDSRWILPQNGLLRLRLLNASPSRYYRLAVEDHPLYLIGTDGGAIEYPVELDTIVLTPGERADILVKGDREPGTYRLLDFGVATGGMHGMGRMHGRGGMHGRGRTNEPTAIAAIEYGEPVRPLDIPDTLGTIDPLPEPETVHRIDLGHGMAPGGMVFLLNGKAFDRDRVDIRTRVGRVEDWEIANRGMTAHPFHIHVNSFQIVSRNGSPEPFRAWKDTVNINPGEVVRLRTRYDDFPGQTVYHCHILDHEDAGMMGILEIEA